MDGENATVHIPQVGNPELEQGAIEAGLIAGPAADLIANLREHIKQLEQSQRLSQTIATGFAAMLGGGQYALPFSFFDQMAGVSVLVEPIEEASVVVFSVAWPERQEAEVAGE